MRSHKCHRRPAPLPRLRGILVVLAILSIIIPVSAVAAPAENSINKLAGSVDAPPSPIATPISPILPLKIKSEPSSPIPRHDGRTVESSVGDQQIRTEELLRLLEQLAKQRQLEVTPPRWVLGIAACFLLINLLIGVWIGLILHRRLGYLEHLADRNGGRHAHTPSHIADAIRELKVSLNTASSTASSADKRSTPATLTALQEIYARLGRIGEHVANMTGALQEIGEALRSLPERSRRLTRDSAPIPPQSGGMPRVESHTAASGTAPGHPGHPQATELTAQTEAEILNAWREFWTSDNGNHKGDVNQLNTILLRHLGMRLDRAEPTDDDFAIAIVRLRDDSTEFVVPLRQTFNPNGYFAADKEKLYGDIEDLLKPATRRDGKPDCRGRVTLSR